MRHIAARAGVAIGNLYRSFPNTDALFYSVIPAAFAALHAPVERVREEPRARRAAQRADDKAQQDAEQVLLFWTEQRLMVTLARAAPLSDRVKSAVLGLMSRGMTDYFSAPQSSPDGTKCCIARMILRAQGVPASSQNGP
jgi:AcrR family transcriptional regulator